MKKNTKTTKTAASTVATAKEKKPSLFAAINTACTATPSRGNPEKRAARLARRYAKSLSLMNELANAGRVRKGKDGEEKKRVLNPGRTVQVVFMLLSMGMAAEAIAQGAPDLAKRFDGWAGCGEAIMHAASVKKVDVNAVAHLFGLVEPEDKVVPSALSSETKKKAPSKAKKSAPSKAKKEATAA